MRIWGCLALSCLFALPAAAGQADLPAGAVVVDAGSVKPETASLVIEAGAIVALAAAGDADGALARLRLIDDPVRFELTAARVVDALVTAPVAAGDALLALLETVPARVFVQHEETAAAYFLPAIDIAGKARSARALLARVQARDAWLARLARQPATAFDPAQAKAVDATALADAIALAPQAVIDALGQASVKSAGGLPSRAQVELARRSDDIGVWDAALAHAAPVDVVPLFALAREKLGDAQARRWLASAARKGEYASAAALAGFDASRAQALAALDDEKTRYEAASTVAQWPDAIATIDGLLADGSATSTRLASLALALRLIDSDAARERLQRLRDDLRLPPNVRTELQR